MLSIEELKRIYELNYKYNTLSSAEREYNIDPTTKQQKDIGNLHLLEDKANTEKLKISSELDTLLNKNLDNIIRVYEAWLQEHTRDGWIAAWKQAPNLRDLFDYLEDLDVPDETTGSSKRVNWKTPTYDWLQEHRIDAIAMTPAWILAKKHGDEILSEFDLDPNNIEQELADPTLDRKVKKWLLSKGWGTTQYMLKKYDISTIAYLYNKLFYANFDDYLSKMHAELTKSVLSAQVINNIQVVRNELAFARQAKGKPFNPKDKTHDNPDIIIRKKLNAFHKGLTTAHHTGSMLDYLFEGKDAKEAKTILDNLSASPHVEKWDKELERAFGYPVEEIQERKYKAMSHLLQKLAAVIDYPRDTLSTDLFKDNKVLLPKIEDFIYDIVYSTLDDLEIPEDALKALYIYGSILTNQWVGTTDVDLRILLDAAKTHAAYPEYNGEQLFDLVKDSLDSTYVGETQHVLNATFVIEGDDTEVAKSPLGSTKNDALYDVMNRKFIVPPWFEQEDFDPDKEFIDDKRIADDIIRQLDNILMETREDVIDYSIIEESINKVKYPDVLREKLANKLEEIESDITKLIKEYNYIKDKRTQGLTDDAKKDLDESRHWAPENVQYKYLERYHYIRLLKDLKHEFKDGVEKSDIPKLKDKLMINPASIVLDGIIDNLAYEETPVYTDMSRIDPETIPGSCCFCGWMPSGDKGQKLKYRKCEKCGAEFKVADYVINNAPNENELTASLKLFAELNKKELEDITELTYKDSWLNVIMRDRGGDLPDNAYHIKIDIENRLDALLSNAMEAVVQTYEEWLRDHSEEGWVESYEDSYRTASEALDNLPSRLADYADTVREKLLENIPYDRDQYIRDEDPEILAENFGDSYLMHHYKFKSKKKKEKALEDPVSYIKDNDLFDDLVDWVIEEQEDYMTKEDMLTSYGSGEVLQVFGITPGDVGKAAYAVWVTDVFPGLADTHKDVGKTYDYIKNWESRSVREQSILLQVALTTMHHHGVMLEHILEIREGTGQDFLDELNSDVNKEKWNKELQRALGFDPINPPSYPNWEKKRENYNITKEK